MKLPTHTDFEASKKSQVLPFDNPTPHGDLHQNTSTIDKKVEYRTDVAVVAKQEAGKNQQSDQQVLATWNFCLLQF